MERHKYQIIAVGILVLSIQYTNMLKIAINICVDIPLVPSTHAKSIRRRSDVTIG